MCTSRMVNYRRIVADVLCLLMLSGLTSPSLADFIWDGSCCDFTNELQWTPCDPEQYDVYRVDGYLEVWLCDGPVDPNDIDPNTWHCPYGLYHQPVLERSYHCDGTGDCWDYAEGESPYTICVGKYILVSVSGYDTERCWYHSPHDSVYVNYTIDSCSANNPNGDVVREVDHCSTCLGLYQAVGEGEFTIDARIWDAAQYGPYTDDPNMHFTVTLVVRCDPNDPNESWFDIRKDELCPGEIATATAHFSCVNDTANLKPGNVFEFVEGTNEEGCEFVENSWEIAGSTFSVKIRAGTNPGDGRVTMRAHHPQFPECGPKSKSIKIKCLERDKDEHAEAPSESAGGDCATCSTAAPGTAVAYADQLDVQFSMGKMGDGESASTISRVRLTNRAPGVRAGRGGLGGESELGA